MFESRHELVRLVYELAYGSKTWFNVSRIRSSITTKSLVEPRSYASKTGSNSMFEVEMNEQLEDRRRVDRYGRRYIADSINIKVYEIVG